MLPRVAVPLPAPGSPPELWTPEALTRIVRAVEQAGLDACSVSDHPFPAVIPVRPGHHAMDPFVLLAHAAAATRRLHLLTGALVVPYRNPFLAASSLATLDHLSGGRLIVGAVAGYQREEFAALGADFDRRLETLETHLDAIRRAWTGAPLTESGAGWSLAGNSLLPLPCADPRPPIWVGGNSRSVLYLVARSGDGWMPFEAEAGNATGSAPIEGVAKLAEKIVVLHELWARSGREGEVDVCYFPRAEFLAGAPDEVLARLDELRRIGVTWVVAGPRAANPDARHRAGASSPSELVERILAFGEILSKEARA